MFLIDFINPFKTGFFKISMNMYFLTERLLLVNFTRSSKLKINNKYKYTCICSHGDIKTLLDPLLNLK